MVLDFSNSSELFAKAKEASLYSKLVGQLIKDFGLANIHIELQESMDPKTLHETLREKVYQLIMERFSEYLNLMYVVDVPERAFKDVKVTDVVEVSDQVSLLILTRELQKVWLKSTYS